MKQFDQPNLTVIEDSMLEPVYAASGGGHNDPPPSSGDWTITTEFCNHNSGSHSELKIKAHNNGSLGGNNLKMIFASVQYKLAEITPGDSCLVVSDFSEGGFTLTRTNRQYNGGENIEFVMQIKVKRPDGTIAAAGETGTVIPTAIFCISYEAN